MSKSVQSVRFEALKDAQATLAEYLCPDSKMSKGALVDRLFGILDNKEIARAMDFASPDEELRAAIMNINGVSHEEAKVLMHDGHPRMTDTQLAQFNTMVCHFGLPQLQRIK